MRFGALVGVAGVHNEVHDDRLRDDRLDQSGSDGRRSAAGTCNGTGGGNWTDPGDGARSNAGNGLTPGATIDQAFLLANNPGRTIQQIDNAIIPRLGRPFEEFGEQGSLQRDRQPRVPADRRPALLPGLDVRQEGERPRAHRHESGSVAMAADDSAQPAG